MYGMSVCLVIVFYCYCVVIKDDEVILYVVRIFFNCYLINVMFYFVLYFRYNFLNF